MVINIFLLMFQTWFKVQFILKSDNLWLGKKTWYQIPNQNIIIRVLKMDYGWELKTYNTAKSLTVAGIEYWWENLMLVTCDHPISVPPIPDQRSLWQAESRNFLKKSYIQWYAKLKYQQISDFWPNKSFWKVRGWNIHCNPMKNYYHDISNECSFKNTTILYI